MSGAFSAFLAHFRRRNVPPQRVSATQTEGSMNWFAQLRAVLQAYYLPGRPADVVGYLRGNGSPGQWRSMATANPPHHQMLILGNTEPTNEEWSAAGVGQRGAQFAITVGRSPPACCPDLSSSRAGSCCVPGARSTSKTTTPAPSAFPPPCGTGETICRGLAGIRDRLEGQSVRQWARGRIVSG
jgi:hypothetical protein